MGGNLHCPHCAVPKVFGMRRCATCGNRCPSNECHGSGGNTRCHQCVGRTSKKRVRSPAEPLCSPPDTH
eukprot:7068168-Prorocentrum_lima.AAC.1